MSEAELAARLMSRLDPTEKMLGDMDSALDRFDELATKLDGLANRITEGSAIMASGPDEERARAFLEARLAPLHAALDEVERGLGPKFLELDWNETAEDAAEQASGDALQMFIGAADKVSDDATNLADEAVSTLVKTLSDAREALDDLITAGDDAADDAGATVDALISAMEQGIPDLGDIVDKLVGEAFNARLQELTGNINEVLDRVEDLVDAAGADVIGRIQGVADVMSQINEIIQPMQPAFDAFEALS